MRLLLTAAAILPLVSPAFALDGQIQIHDPATVVQCNGQYYTFGTGGTTLVSDDGWTWRRGVTPARRGMAPDIIHLGDRYYLYVAVINGGGATDFCARFLDAEDRPLKGFTVSVREAGQ